jgi:hypothetical protein
MYLFVLFIAFVGREVPSNLFHVIAKRLLIMHLRCLRVKYGRDIIQGLSHRLINSATRIQFLVHVRFAVH